MAKPTEQEVITAFERREEYMTYHLANVITANRGYKDKVTTPQVLRLLKKMEIAGRVKRVRSNYAIQICWSLTNQEQS